MTDKEKMKTLLKPRSVISFIGYLANNQGSATLRVALPFLYMSGIRNDDYRFFASCFDANFPILDPNFYNNFCFILYQGVVRPQHLELIEYFKNKTKTRIIYEIDDYLLDIPDWNFTKSFFKEHRDSFEKIMRKVDMVTVSTEYLKNKYLHLNPKINVIPNRLSKFLWGEPKFTFKNHNKLKIVYPCSQAHFYTPTENKAGGDIGNVLLKYVISTRNRFEWIFMGGAPRELYPFIISNEIKLLPWTSYLQYPLKLKELNADIGIAPLAINEFNKSKSNIKMLDFVGAGIPAVYTDIECYTQARLKSKTEDQFIENIEKLCDPIEREKTWQHDYEKVKLDIFWEENDNLLKYVNSHLDLLDKEMKVQLQL